MENLPEGMGITHISPHARSTTQNSHDGLSWAIAQLLAQDPEPASAAIIVAAAFESAKVPRALFRGNWMGLKTTKWISTQIQMTG